MLEVAGIYIWQSEAYLPVLGKTEVGFFWEAGPLLTAELNVDSLTMALEKIVESGNPLIRHPSQTEFRKTTPVQKTLDMRSWRKMAEAGVIRCGIWWLNEKVLVAFSPQDAKDIQETDFDHQREFPINTPLRVIVKYILQEIKERRLTSQT
jgi:hypothetical protein